MWAIFCLLGLVTAWIFGDWVYSRAIRYAAGRWEKTISRTADGVQAGCNAYSLGAGETALLFVHGLNASPRIFDNLATGLAEQRFACRVARLSGFAESLDAYARATRADWIEDLEREIDELRATHPRVLACGHSLGATITLAASLRRPGSIDGMILLAPALAVSDARSPLLPTRAWHRIGRRVLMFSQVVYSPFRLDCHDQSAANYPGLVSFTPAAVIDQLFALIDEVGGRASEVVTPLLMVLTEHDRVVDWQVANEFYERVGSAYKQRLMLERSGHAIPIDQQWIAVATAIAEFAGEIGE